MSLQEIRIGVSDIELPIQSANTMGSLTGITPVVCIVDKDIDESINNDSNTALSTSDTYTFVLALAGEDRVRGGYTIAHSSEESAGISIADEATEMIRIEIDEASLPTNYEEAAFMAVFMKVNSSSTYQLCRLAPVRDGKDFACGISFKPLRTAGPKTSLALLQSTTSNRSLGSRIPYGYTFEVITPTTGDIAELYDVSQVNVPINTGPDFNARTSVAAGLEFSILLNDIKSIVRAIGGHVHKFETSDGEFLTEGFTGLATAQAILSGNRPVRVNYPPNGNGESEVAIYLGLRTQNNNNLRMAWSKSGITPVTITYETVIAETFLISQHAKITYLETAA